MPPWLPPGRFCTLLPFASGVCPRLSGTQDKGGARVRLPRKRGGMARRQGFLQISFRLDVYHAVFPLLFCFPPPSLVFEGGSRRQDGILLVQETLRSALPPIPSFFASMCDWLFSSLFFSCFVSGV